MAVGNPEGVKSYLTVDRAHKVVSSGVLDFKVEEGNLFFVSDRVTGIATSTPQYWLFRTPAGIWTHAHAIITVEAGAVVELFETPTTSADGTALTIWNRNRNIEDVNGTEFYRGPTVSDDGTNLFSRHQGGSGNAGQEFSGTVQNETKFILAAGTDYLFKVTADADGLGATLEIEYYETEALV